MKKSQRHGIIAACLLPVLLALSPAVFGEEAAARYIKQRNAVDSAPGFWTIPPISQRWDAPRKSSHWTIPPVNQRWGIPERSGHWTIPRSANDIASPDK